MIEKPCWSDLRNGKDGIGAHEPWSLMNSREIEL